MTENSNTRGSAQVAIDSFHAHLDCCRRCREQPFNLCPIGRFTLTRETAQLAVDILNESKGFK